MYNIQYAVGKEKARGQRAQSSGKTITLFDVRKEEHAVSAIGQNRSYKGG